MLESHRTRASSYDLSIVPIGYICWKRTVVTSRFTKCKSHNKIARALSSVVLSSRAHSATFHNSLEKRNPERCGVPPAGGASRKRLGQSSSPRACPHTTGAISLSTRHSLASSPIWKMESVLEEPLTAPNSFELSIVTRLDARLDTLSNVQREILNRGPSGWTLPGAIDSVVVDSRVSARCVASADF